MTAFSRIALIGFGEVGQTLGADLLATDVTRICAYDVLFSDKNSLPSQALAKTPLHVAADAAEAAKGAELVISAVTAAADVEAARAVATGLEPGTFFLDLNSASPSMKQETARIIEAAGGHYVEAAVMTPIAPKRIASYMLLGGPHAALFIERARPLGFIGEVFSDTVGRASATKMCRSVIIKGVEALLSESMLAARHYGVEKTVLDSLSDLLPVGDWERLARYFIGRALEHGARRAEEMREAARTVADAGIEPLMAAATAKRQDETAEFKAALAHSDELGPMLDAIRAILETKKRRAPAAAE